MPVRRAADTPVVAEDWLPKLIQNPIATEADVDLTKIGRKQRRELTAFISQDNGHTWSQGLVIDQRVGCTYPDAQQAADGTIYVTWDFNRSKDQEILITNFREDDMLSTDQDATARVKTNRLLVSKGGTK